MVITMAEEGDKGNKASGDRASSAASPGVVPSPSPSPADRSLGTRARESPDSEDRMLPGQPGHNVVLTGFMGTGKTTVGVLLAERLGFDFVDTDALIEARHGPIPEIFRSSGESAFRRFEHDVAVELGARSSHVVSTGGRLLLDPANAAALGRTGSVFCLTATIRTTLDRVMNDAVGTRPLLAGSNVRERIETLLAERAEGYAQFIQVPTDGRDPEQIVDEIIDLLAADPATRSAPSPDEPADL
jgi:shikimate kinase